ncbi:GGDEF domain-containing protein, partial [Psychrosphaera sp.]|nr:GGDEF domain-containing protein [Psychrosphaera sp.]
MNRRGAQAVLESEYSRTQRTQRHFSIAIGDIDHFKRINDTLGHEKGDDVLVAISSLFKKRIRQQDVLARWGGEEFMFIFPETTAKDARRVLESLRETLSQSPLKINDAELWVTCSFGLCEVNESIGISNAIREADKALYQAKDSGRNNVVLKTDE